MSFEIIKKYIKLCIAESTDALARVPTQLLSPQENQDQKDNNKDKEKSNDDSVDEFSGAGAAAGFTTPLNVKRKK